MGMYGRVLNFLRAPAKSFIKKKIKKKEMIIICSIEGAQQQQKKRVLSLEELVKDC